jgi:FkbM family methyltransferase
VLLHRCGSKGFRADHFVATEIYSRKTYDTVAVPSRGDTVVDVGAHIGAYTLRAATAVGPSGMILAVEPHPGNFSLLRLNLILNRLRWVKAAPVCLGSQEGTAELFLSDRSNSSHSSARRVGGRSLRVRQTTLDALLSSGEIRHVDLLKMDAEGAEMDILKGASKSLHFIDRMTIAAYHSPDEAGLCSDYLSQEGFEVSTHTVDGEEFVQAVRRPS